jgi:hypothetical protein
VALSPGSRMPSYKLYCMQSQGNLHFAEWIEAKDDAEAIAIARKLKKDALKCEVWHGRRLVAVLDAHELAA